MDNNREAKLIKEHGFVVHYAPCGKEPTHSHGLDTSYYHKNLEIPLRMPPKVAHAIITNIVGHIKQGKVLKDKQYLEGFLKNDYKIYVRETKSRFKLLFPDAKGKFEDTEDPNYKAQYEELEPKILPKGDMK